jgi:hypothetical protein
VKDRKYNKCFSSNSSSSSSSSSNYRKADIAGIIFFGSICLGAASLGVWQTQRYTWKTKLIEEQKMRYKFYLLLFLSFLSSYYN